MTTTILLSIGFFLLVIMLLVGLLLFAKAKLSPSGAVTITINSDQKLEVEGGSTLLNVLSNNGVFLPSACGGGGGGSVYTYCGAGGGGGSSWASATVLSVTYLDGAGQIQGNEAQSNGAGRGGERDYNSASDNGADGRVLISW